MQALNQVLNNETLMLAFVALTGIALSAQAVILLAIFLSLRKAAKGVKEDIDELRATIVPVAGHTREVIARLAPKVEAATTDVMEMVRILRIKSDELDESVSEMLERLHRQSDGSMECSQGLSTPSTGPANMWPRPSAVQCAKSRPCWHPSRRSSARCALRLPGPAGPSTQPTIIAISSSYFREKT